MTDVELFQAFSTYQQGRAFTPRTVKRRRCSPGTPTTGLVRVGRAAELGGRDVTAV